MLMRELDQADWKEGFKKKQAGVSDMTLLSTISNDAINDNLKKRCVKAAELSLGAVADVRCSADGRTARSTFVPSGALIPSA